MAELKEHYPWAVRVAGIIHHKSTQWTIRVIVVLLFILVAFSHLHLMHDPVSILGIILVLVLFLSEQNNGVHVLMERRDRNFRLEVERQANALKASLADARLAIVRLNEDMRRKLLSLKECVESLSQSIAKDSKEELVVIEHLGLDLSNAWDYIARFVKEPNNYKKLSYKLLIITDDVDTIQGANDEVRSWSKHVADEMLKRIKRDIVVFQDRAIKSGGELVFEIKKYATVPYAHGVRIVAPDRLKVCYVAFCRWTDDGENFFRYDWGDPQYHCILGEPSDPSQRDLSAVFDGHFKHLWHHGTAVVSAAAHQSA